MNLVDLCGSGSWGHEPWLSFFILKEDRQIFFATASTRLASLFEKKFEFLESDFKKWELKR